MKKEDKENLKESLDELLSYDLPDEVPGLEEDHDLKPVKNENKSLAVKQKNSKNKAKRVMNNLLKFYLSEEIIEEQEYIKAKTELDEMALSSLIMQMQNSEIAIEKLMETIDDGAQLTPRLFEVLSDLQRTLLDIIKSQTMYMITVEENAKKIARDLDVYQNIQSGDATNTNTKSRGTKDLMKALKELDKDEDGIVDAEEIDDED